MIDLGGLCMIASSMHSRSLFSSRNMREYRRVTPLLYSTFRGKDGGRKLKEHLGRLLNEIQIESERRNEFLRHVLDDAEMEKRARQKLYDRNDWDDKFTTDEREFIDNWVGAESFERLIKLNFVGTDYDTRKMRILSYMALETLPKLIDRLKKHVGSVTSRQLFGNAVETLENKSPTVSPDVGFPSNQEILEKHEEWIDFLKKSKNSGYSGVGFGPTTRKSPFGPVSSSSCFEELSALQSVHLKQLFETSIAGAMPNAKMLLTIRHKTVVSQSKIVTTVVEDETGQCIHMQIHNMRGVDCNVDGLVDMPVGARFYLKNPFMKIGNDGWLLLRVDQPFDLERLDIPPLHGSILVVGDGDFSYSAALAKQNRERGQAHILTTSLDSRETVVKRYAKADASLGSLSGDPSVSTFHGLNASDLSRLRGQKFDSIVWNFPYPQGKPLHAGSVCGELMKTCLPEMARYLKPSGRVFLTLSQKQGGTSHEASSSTLGWDMETVADEAGMDIVDVVPFEAATYEGYEPRREYIDEPFPSINAKTHILRPKQESDPGEQASRRTIFSRLSSFLLDIPWTRHGAVISRENAVVQLASSAHTSKTARSLLEAAEAFRSAQKFLDAKPQGIRDSTKAIACLSQVLSTNEGELTILFKGDQQLVTAVVCGRTVLSSFFTLSPGEESLLLDTDRSNSTQFLRALCRVQNKFGRDEEIHRNVISFEESLLVFVSLAWMAEGTDYALETISIAISLAPKSKELVYFRAAMRATFMNDKSKHQNECYSKSEVIQVIHDCEAALEVIQDETHHRYASTIYVLARMNLDLGILSMESRTLDKTALWKAIALHETYINLVEPDDRGVASAHYRLGLLHMLVNQPDQSADLKLVRTHYVAGLSAEKDRLPFFGPLTCPFKRVVGLALMTKEETQEGGKFPKKTDIPQDIHDDKGSTDISSSVSDEPVDAKFLDRVRLLLSRHPNGIYLGMFRELFFREFGEPVPKLSHKSLRCMMESAQAKDACRVEKRGKTEIWVKPATESDDAFFKNLKNLLREHPDGIYFGTFRKLYEQMTGKKITKDKKSLRQLMSLAEEKGICRLEFRGTCELWVEPGIKTK